MSEAKREEKLFWHYARSEIEAMRLLFRGGKLSPKEGDWNNVINHCLTQAAVADVLAPLLRLSEGDQEELRNTALCNDCKKRLEKRPNDFTEEQRQRAEELLEEVPLNGELLEATELGFSRKIIEGQASFLQRLQFYIDDITQGSEVVELEERIAEAEGRTQLNDDPELTKTLGCPHGDIERLAARLVEQEIFFRLRGLNVDIDLPRDLPLLIRKKIQERFKLESRVEEREESDYHFSILCEKQPEGGNRQNEDTFMIVEDDKVLIAAVMDGATPLPSIVGTDGLRERKGWFAAQLAAIGIEKNYSRANSPVELLLKGNQQIADVLLSQGANPEEAVPLGLSNTQAVLVRIDKIKKTISVASIGDAACLIKDKNGGVELALPLDLTPEDNEALRFILEVSRQRKISVKEAMMKYPEKVNEILTRGRELCNKPDGSGVGVLDGRRSAELYIRSKDYSLNEVSEVIVLTDGLFLPNELIGAEPDWEEMVGIIEKVGIEGLYQEVLKRKNSDPDLNRYPRFKKHDDATGIVIEIDQRSGT
jgi:hypothetical protein